MKNKILGWLFKSYAEGVKEDGRKTLELQMEAFKATFDVKDLIREKLKGIRPSHPDDDTVLQTHLAGLDDASRLAFLAKAHAVITNETYQVVIKSLIVESLHDAMLNAGDMTEVNFNRATINGLILVEDELMTLDKMYLEEQERTKKMTEEERLSAL
jgi:hypothetical protein